MTMYKPKEMAEKLGVTVRTLQKWDCSGKLPAYRTPTNRRYYTEEQYLAYIGENQAKERKVVAYARVPTRSQRDDLKNQIQFIQMYANGKGIILDEAIEDFGSGLNYKRKKWLELLEAVDRNEIGTIFVTYKDRFIRFGYDYFERFCQNHQTKLIALNNKESSPTQELVDDLVSIIHVFSSRLYGLRKYPSKIKEDKSLKAGDGDAGR
ncbi:MAG: IS607 family transposase [Selenomonadaceae bacterium]|nr:IS607 family transposase [Selenomonadaceae bacterium]MDY2685621.1 IS607 family transposase [Selenomonadaceae bacterium]